MFVWTWAACIENNFVRTFGDTFPPNGTANPLDVPPSDRTDRFLQVVEHQVDVLWVVDNSPSIEDNRALLASTFPLFIEAFQAVEADWHIGVITTDMDTPGHQGALQARDGHTFISRDTPDPVAVFTSMVTEMTGESLDERGRDAAWTATELLRETVNAGFLRDSELAWLHFTVVTDENDDSEQIELEQFVNYVNFIRPVEDRSSWNSIVSTNGIGPEEAGTDYIELSTTLGGAVADINNPDWPAVIAELGGTQAPDPIVEFFLTARPVPGTVDVQVTEPSGVVITFLPDVDWTWSEPRNSVTFLNYVPPLGATVEIHYRLAAT